MGFDLKQVVAAVLTVTMFVMLGNMIKRDHFDSVDVSEDFKFLKFGFFLCLDPLNLDNAIEKFEIFICIF